MYVYRRWYIKTRIHGSFVRYGAVYGSVYIECIYVDNDDDDDDDETKSGYITFTWLYALALRNREYESLAVPAFDSGKRRKCFADGRVANRLHCMYI